MAFLTKEEINDIKENKHCSKCGNAAFEKTWSRERSTFSKRKREIDFECQTCGHVVRYIRSRPSTRVEIFELCEKRKKDKLSFVDRVIEFFRGKK